MEHKYCPPIPSPYNAGSSLTRSACHFHINISLALLVLWKLLLAPKVLWRPMTYDNHPSVPSHPVRHIALIELNSPKIDQSRPKMTLDDLKWSKMTIRQNERKTKSPSRETWLIKMADIIKWGFKNELQQIRPPNLSISDVETSNEYITTNYIHL